MLNQARHMDVMSHSVVCLILLVCLILSFVDRNGGDSAAYKWGQFCYTSSGTKDSTNKITIVMGRK